MPATKPKRKITVNVSEEFHGEFAAYARGRNLSQAELIRHALAYERYIEENPDWNVIQAKGDWRAILDHHCLVREPMMPVDVGTRSIHSPQSAPKGTSKKLSINVGEDYHAELKAYAAATDRVISTLIHEALGYERSIFDAHMDGWVVLLVKGDIESVPTTEFVWHYLDTPLARGQRYGLAATAA